MSKRESRDEETRVSPYLLRPARTYEEYLRDRAIADRLQKQLEGATAISLTATTKKSPAKPPVPAWKTKNAPAEQP